MLDIAKIHPRPGAGNIPQIVGNARCFSIFSGSGHDWPLGGDGQAGLPRYPLPGAGRDRRLRRIFSWHQGLGGRGLRRIVEVLEPVKDAPLKVLQFLGLLAEAVAEVLGLLLQFRGFLVEAVANG